MVQFSNNNEYIRFCIEGYQYPDQKAVTNEYDANWLFLSYGFSMKGRQWERTDPSLLIWELRELAGWLEKMKSDNPNPVSKEMYFTEPNLSFRLIEKNKKSVTLRVCIDAELKYADSEEDEYLECTLDQQALADLIKSIRVELANFPQRDCSYF